MASAETPTLIAFGVEELGKKSWFRPQMCLYLFASDLFLQPCN